MYKLRHLEKTDHSKYEQLLVPLYSQNTDWVFDFDTLFKQ